MVKGMGISIEWTDQAVQFLRDNAGKLTAAEIANGLGTGHSRVAVIGKMHRMGLEGRKQGLRLPRPEKKRRPRTSGVKPRPKWSLPKSIPKSPTYYVEPVMPKVADGQPPLHSRAFADLEYDMCQWPVYVEQGVQMFCGATIDRHRQGAYCKCHAEMAVIPPSERKRRYRAGIWAI